MEKKRLVKNLDEVAAYRLTQLEDRIVTLFVDKDIDGARKPVYGHVHT